MGYVDFKEIGYCEDVLIVVITIVAVFSSSSFASAFQTRYVRTVAWRHQETSLRARHRVMLSYTTRCNSFLHRQGYDSMREMLADA